MVALRKQATGRRAAPKTVAVFADPVFERDDPRLGGMEAPPDAPAEPPPPEPGLIRAFANAGFLRDAVSRIPRLPGTRREAEAILSLAAPDSSMRAVGFEASRTTALSRDLELYRIVHFATHGLLNDKHPELSGVVLSMFDEKGAPQDGFLRLHDIYNLNLRADLVVLSACSTGLGKEVRGEGLLGLARGFMHAGAQRVLASLWKVDDEATGELMDKFYRHMLSENVTPAASLRRAQLEMRRQSRWSAPFYWAGFVLQGEWQ
jgi:CHAT domain-containing protein